MTLPRKMTRIVAAVVIGLVGHAAAPATAAPVVRLGDVRFVVPDDRTRSLSEGDHATAFALELPQGATCPGDSANDDWRLQSFVVPETDDPATLEYMVTGPDGPDPQHDARVALYTTEGRPFVHQLLGANTEPGRPGDVVELPAMSFARLPVDYLPSGTYRVGLACTYFGATAQYWDTGVLITAEPTAMRWSVLGGASDDDGSAVPADGGSAGLPITIGAVVSLALVAGAVMRRRSRTNPPLVKENR